MSAFSAFGRPKSRSKDEQSSRSVSLDTTAADSVAGARTAVPHEYGANLEPERSRWGRAQSKSGFLGLFRGKSKEPNLKQQTLHEGERIPRTSLAPPTNAARLSSMPAIRTSALPEEAQPRNHSSSGIEAPLLDSNSLSPFAQAPKANRMSRMPLDPPALCSVYSQATKHGFVTTPAGPTEALLRAYMSKHSARHNETDPFQLESGTEQPATPLPVDAFTTKVYVLTTAGYLLQYAGDGNADRKPEKVMQLTDESAAMACDAVPGKHWVLHVSESFVGNEPVLNPRVSRFGLAKIGIGSKKSAENYLMIMESPDELDSWLMTIRHVIQSFGRQDFKLDRPSSSSTAAGRDDDENISPRSSYAYEGTMAREAPPLVRLERAASQVQRKPVGSGLSGSGLQRTASQDPSEEANVRLSTAESNAESNSAHGLNPELDQTGGKDFVARVSTDGTGLEHGHSNETQQNEEGEPSTTLGPGHARGNAPSHRSQNSTDSLSSQRSSSYRVRSAATGRRRSSSIQSSSGTARGALKEVIPPADRTVPRHSSPNRLSPTAESSEPNLSRPVSNTGLRKRTTVIRIDSRDSTAPKPSHSESREPVTVPSPQTRENCRERSEQDIRDPQIQTSDGLLVLSKARSTDRDSGSTATERPRNSFRRLTPDPEHGPVVLTPPESPQVAEYQAGLVTSDTGSIAEQNRLVLTTRAEEISLEDLDDGPEASPGLQDIHSPSLSVQQLDDPLNSPLSTTTELMPGDSPARAVAIVIPSATARPVQVDVPRSPTFSSIRSQSIVSLKAKNSDSKDMLTATPTGAVTFPAATSHATGSEAARATDVIQQQHEAEELEKGQRTHSSSISSINSSIKSSASRIPPRQSSLLYGHGIFPSSVPASMAGSAPSSGRSTPSSAHRKESVVSNKTSQLRQKLAAIDTARLSHANSTHLFTPSPHPAPTGALPALPPGASKGRSPVGSRPSSRADRSRAPSATSLRNESVVSSVSHQDPPESDERSVTPSCGHSRSGSQDAIEGDIIESTRARQPKVEKVTLAPMSDVTGVAERRRNRSPSPGNASSDRDQAQRVPAQAAEAKTQHGTAGWRSGKALSLIRESSVRSTSTLIARSERNNRTEIEQIEEDLNSHDDSLPPFDRISPEAINSELFLNLDTTSPTAQEIQEAHTESKTKDYSKAEGTNGGKGEEGEGEDACDEIPIVLAISPRTVLAQSALQLDNSLDIRGDSAAEGGQDDDIALTTSMPYPERTSSISQTGNSQMRKAERPLLLRLATTGSLQKVDASEAYSASEFTAASPVSVTDDKADADSASRTQHGMDLPSPPIPPPSRPPPPIPVSASSSSITSPSDSSVASPTSRTTSPSVPMSKFSPQATHWNSSSSSGLYLRKQSAESESEGAGGGLSASSLARHEQKLSKQNPLAPPPLAPPAPPKSSLAALAKAAAPERTPPLKMQASVTDFSQDDFFGWSMPVYSGHSEDDASRNRDEQEGFEGMDTPRASTYANQNESTSSTSHVNKEGEPEPFYKPLELSGLQLSLADDNIGIEQSQPSEAEPRTDENTAARDQRWSLFGAIEGIS